MQQEEVYSYLFAPVRVLSWVVALPLRVVAWAIWRYRAYSYDPEKLTCPACGFSGDSGTNGKSCIISYTRTQGNEKAAIQHICFRCGCDEIFTKLYLPADKWINSHLDARLEKIKRAAAERVL